MGSGGGGGGTLGGGSGGRGLFPPEMADDVEDDWRRMLLELDIVVGVLGGSLGVPRVLGGKLGGSLTGRLGGEPENRIIVSLIVIFDTINSVNNVT